MSTVKKIYNGEIKKVGVYPLTKPDQYGNTFRWSVVLEDDSFLNFGNQEYDNFTVKDDDGKWKVLGAGSVINIMYEEVTKGDKVHQNGKRGNLNILTLVEGEKKPRADAAPAQQASPAQAPAPDKPPFDQVGTSIGHAQKCAVILEKMGKRDYDTAFKEAVDVSYKLVEELVANKTKRYKAGLEVGCAVNSACYGLTKTQSLEDRTRVLLANNKRLTEYVEGVYNPKPKEEKKEAAPTPQQPDSPPTPPPAEQQAPDVDDWDDDIPF